MRTGIGIHYAAGRLVGTFSAAAGRSDDRRCVGELARYADTVADFIEVIRLNPRIAGYYDNRQNARRQMGALEDVLSDPEILVLTNTFPPRLSTSARLPEAFLAGLDRMDCQPHTARTAVAFRRNGAVVTNAGPEALQKARPRRRRYVGL